ncbi:hypothetical protein [uncultured Ruminococcus sp.]|uniref:hypothetical protein n=1 Tax=uncultured Ruminococcus sp. TaxID=165186 RepID=UPI00292EAAB2|nr:hypothetical protein [uncultured Ruminococcus sp.]
MYELDYSLVRLNDWNEYFVRYRETGEINYYNEFLHFYEPVLDKRVEEFIRRFELEEYRAEDLKQIFSSLLWKDLQTYDSDIPLLQLIKFKVLSAWHEYVRLNCGNFQPDNRSQYTLLRKIARLYYAKSDDKKTTRQIIAEIAKELELTEKSVEDYITAVATFKPKYNADFYIEEEDGDFYSPIPDSYTTEDWFFRLEQKKKLISALADLTITEQKLIESRFGICLSCLGNLPKSSMSIVSMSLGLTESGAEKKLKAILKKLRKAIQE